MKRKTSGSRQRGFLNSRQAFVLLGLLFITPAFVAWVMHHSTEGGWRPEGTTNRGILVHPARPLSMPDGLMVDELSANDYLRGKWTLLYIGDADCDAVCNENLYKMRQVAAAQNENVRRVQKLYLVLGTAMPAATRDRLDKEYRHTDILRVTDEQAAEIAPFFLIDDQGMQGAERVYYIDPLGNLMMYYPADADPGGMLKDLKKLLKYSKIG